MFDEEIKRQAFQSANGEFGWKRNQVPTVVATLVEQDLAILGGELWLVPLGSQGWTGLIPQKVGPPAVYAWETKRRQNEPWHDFIKRSAQETLNWIKILPKSELHPDELSDQIFYNLTWASESEFSDLHDGAA